MKYELFIIVNAFESFKQLQESNEIPFKTAWKIEDIQETFRKHVKRFNDEKNKLIKEFGKPDTKNPEMYMLKPENMTVFNEKIDLLGKTMIDIKKPVKIAKKELFDIDIKVNGKVQIKDLKLFIVD